MDTGTESRLLGVCGCGGGAGGFNQVRDVVIRHGPARVFGGERETHTVCGFASRRMFVSEARLLCLPPYGSACCEASIHVVMCTRVHMANMLS